MTDSAFPPPPPPPPAGPQPPAPDAPPTALPRRARDRALRDPGGPRGAIVAWIAILAAVAVTVVLPLALPSPVPDPAAAEVIGEGETGEGEEAAPPGEAPEAAELPPPGIFGEALKPIVLTKNPQQARKELEMAGGMFVRGPPDRIRIAIIAGDAIGPEAAMEQLDKLEPDELDAALKHDAETLRTLYQSGPGAISAAAGERLARRYGWFGRLATTLGQQGAERDELLADARRVYITVLVFNILIFSALVVGVGLFITGVTLLLMGRLRRGYAAPAPGGSAYLETFALFLVGYLVLSIPIELLGPVIGPWHHLLRWVMLGVVLWPLLRGAQWGQARFALGWHGGRGAVRELLLGVVGYIACLPIVGLGLLITLGMMAGWARLTQAEEEGAGPSHPIGDMLAQAGPLEIAMLLMVGVLWAPVVEETVFRGAFYHHLRGRMGVLGAGLITGLIFAAIHPQGIFAIPVLASVGFVLCLLREWRGTLLAPIAAHALNNGVILTLMVLLMM